MRGLLLFVLLFAVSSASMFVGYRLKNILDWAQRRFRSKSEMQSHLGERLLSVLRDEPDFSHSSDRPFQVRVRETGLLVSRHESDAAATEFLNGRADKADLVIRWTGTAAEPQRFFQKPQLMPARTN